MKACPKCGVLEQRKRDSKGRETLNLDPISGLCIPCLVKSKGAKPMPAEPFDARKAQCGDED